MLGAHDAMSRRMNRRLPVSFCGEWTVNPDAGLCEPLQLYRV
ncbi:hypothetical protein J2T07_002295 [Luteibacter jiangsuensis]|uniref:Uncharacterized protein n=1 Tax=Luteibacter jiangsuensis TaxID=637577 RepID=A0ABT9SZD3_9GAMM|nr:hypothetical protein [Luteibacter jiangsuensis]